MSRSLVRTLKSSIKQRKNFNLDVKSVNFRDNKYKVGRTAVEVQDFLFG